MFLTLLTMFLIPTCPPPPPNSPTPGKLSSIKTVPDAKKVGDHCHSVHKFTKIFNLKLPFRNKVFNYTSQIILNITKS